MSPTSYDPQIITRFAPSPTGFLHIGGARTALFNWLFARHHNGKFLLRIEDTDRKRSTPEATKAIYEGLKWLDLDWDGDALSQFSRLNRHQQIAMDLLDKGAAYMCFSTPEDITAAKEQARTEGRSTRFESPWRNVDPADYPLDREGVVRIKAPREGHMTIADAVQGEVSWEAGQLDDMVLLRSDGTPTYMLAVVVDDYDMGITHVIRGDDHLNNAARQSLIFDAMGWPRPVFAHIPLIHGPDGAKLSKRHGALGIDAYRDMGYTPEGVRNYLARLGWSHGDAEVFSTEEAVAWFSLEGIGRAPSRMDFDKLASVNAHHLRTLDDEALMKRLTDYAASQNYTALKEQHKAAVARALPFIKTRTKTLKELIQQIDFICKYSPSNFTDKARKSLTDEGLKVLGELTSRLQNAREWQIAAVEQEIKSFASEKDLKMGAVAQPVRAALTGGFPSPGIYEIMMALGRDECLARLDTVLRGSEWRGP